MAGNVFLNMIREKFFQEKNYSEIIELCISHLALYPKDLEVMRFQAAALVRENRSEDAIEIITLVIEYQAEIFS